jgi:hypothetical protein
MKDTKNFKFPVPVDWRKKDYELGIKYFEEKNNELSKELKQMGKPKIQQTNDLSLFTMDDSLVKRALLNKKQCVRLEKSMSENGWDKNSTIVVDRDYKVIDGHYRLLSAKSLNIPVQFLVVDGQMLINAKEMMKNRKIIQSTIEMRNQRFPRYPKLARQK